jgi:hypothetical protein
MQQLADQLKATVIEWAGRLASIDEAGASERRYEGAWSGKEILGHLIDSAANNHQRFVRLQFVSYLELAGYEQASWVRSQGYHEEHWSDLIALWRGYNLHLSHIIRMLPPAALSNLCKIADYEPMTLEFIATDYLRHMRHHLEQIAAKS